MAEYGFGNPRLVEEEVDILLIGGGMACCGAAVEIMRWADGAGYELGGREFESLRAHQFNTATYVADSSAE